MEHFVEQLPCLHDIPLSAKPVGQNGVGDEIGLNPPQLHDSVKVEGVVQHALPAVSIHEGIVGDDVGIEPFRFHLIQELHGACAAVAAVAQGEDKYVEGVRIGKDTGGPHFTIQIPALVVASGFGEGVEKAIEGVGVGGESCGGGPTAGVDGVGSATEAGVDLDEHAEGDGQAGAGDGGCGV